MFVCVFDRCSFCYSSERKEEERGVAGEREGFVREIKICERDKFYKRELAAAQNNTFGVIDNI